MSEIKLKPEFAKHENGFLGTWGPMGERSAEDLKEFYKQAKEHNIADDLAMFEGEEVVAAVDPPAAVVPPAPKRPKAAVVAKDVKKANKKLAKQTPSTPEEAALNEIHGEGGGNPAPVVSATDNTAITPAT